MRDNAWARLPWALQLSFLFHLQLYRLSFWIHGFKKYSTIWVWMVVSKQCEMVQVWRVASKENVRIKGAARQSVRNSVSFFFFFKVVAWRTFLVWSALTRLPCNFFYPFMHPIHLSIHQFFDSRVKGLEKYQCRPCLHQPQYKPPTQSHYQEVFWGNHVQSGKELIEWEFSVDCCYIDYNHALLSHSCHNKQGPNNGLISLELIIHTITILDIWTFLHRRFHPSSRRKAQYLWTH